MKTLLLFLLTFLPVMAIADSGYSMVLENDELLIVMDMKCSVYDVACDKIQYRVFNKKTSVSIKGNGKSINAGVNQNFKGYLLKQGHTDYSLYQTAEDDTWDIVAEKDHKEVSNKKIKAIFDSRAG